MDKFTGIVTGTIKNVDKDVEERYNTGGVVVLLLL